MSEGEHPLRKLLDKREMRGTAWGRHVSVPENRDRNLQPEAPAPSAHCLAGLNSRVVINRFFTSLLRPHRVSVGTYILFDDSDIDDNSFHPCK